VLVTAALACAAPLGAQTQKGPAIPAPVGMVNDFANVIPAEQAARIDALATAVRAKSGGEIVVVTLPDIAGRDVGDVALSIGREWKVGSNAKIGDAARNTGVIILVVPKESSKDGKGYITITTGQGTEGFITDGQAGDIRREAIPYLQARDYGSALELITQRVAAKYASQFGFTLDDVQQPQLPERRVSRSRRSGGRLSPGMVLVIIIVLLVMMSNRTGRGCLWALIASNLNSGGGHYRGGGGGFGGGGGGGFGGFGGGGGFSGGGSSGSW
jgi:uncharacterized protein